MGMDQSFVVARWDRPLEELAFHREQPGPLSADEDFSWSREDGWQCFSPWDVYQIGLLEQVEMIDREIGGPVLAMEVLDSSSWHVAFMEDGRVRHVGEGELEYDSFEDTHRKMIDAWGQDWTDAAAASLQRWARPIVEVPSRALRLVLAAPRLFTEEVLFDLLQLLTLVENPLEPAWWTSSIPGSEYAVRFRDLYFHGAGRHRNDEEGMDLALTSVSSGFGVWSIERGGWATEPITSLSGMLADLREQRSASGPD